MRKAAHSAASKIRFKHRKALKNRIFSAHGQSALRRIKLQPAFMLDKHSMGITLDKLPLSVSIITRDEEQNIGRTLQSVQDIASEIIVVDSGSTDRTADIARTYGATVYIESWKGHIAQKNSALEKCSQEWILALDADEVVSERLADSIRVAVEQPTAVGYFINRKTFYLGKFLEHSWQPDRKLRLVQRSAAPEWGGYNPHDALTMRGAPSFIEGPLHHYSYKSLEDHFHRTVSYAKLTAQSYYDLGKRFSLFKALFNPLMAGFKKLILKRGFLDGYRGCIVAASAVLSVFLKYMFLWDLERTNKDTAA